MHTGSAGRVAPARTLAATAAIAACLGLAACGGSPAAVPAAAPPPAASPFAAVPTLAQAAAPGFVGRDAAGSAVGLRITGPGTAVAYVCDGAAVGAWYTGTVGADGAVALTAADGSTLTATRTATGLTGTHGAGLAFTLAPAAPGTGLFRDVAEIDGATVTTGWVVGADGSIVGRSVDGDGAVVATVSEAADGAEPGAEESVGAGPEPVPTAFVKRVRCGILGFRQGFNASQFANATDPDDIADAEGDNDRIRATQGELGCDSIFK